MKSSVANSLGGLVVVCVVLALQGCGEVDDPSGSDETGGATTVKTGAILNQWTAWVSEEQPLGVTCGSDQAVATMAACSGSYCDNMQLYCGPLPHYTTKTGTGTFWSPYISEEGSPIASCPLGQAIDGIRATGSYADNISIHCSPLSDPPGATCGWMPSFSEEQGSQRFNIFPLNLSSSWATAVTCSGRYCDNLSFLVCQPICRNNADCWPGVSVCNTSNGRCEVWP